MVKMRSPAVAALGLALQAPFLQLVAAAPAETPICDATTTRAVTLSVDGRERTFLAHVPEHARGRRLPVVIAFHGRGETPERLEAYSGLSRLRAVVVYPRGLPGSGGKRSWSGTPTAANGVDDVRFTLAILDRLARTSCADRQRIYATGKSDGGGLAAQLACVAADRFAGVAPIAGAYYPIAGGCRPTRAIAILEMHGSADRVVPYDGSSRRDLPDIHVWLAAWAGRDGCSSAFERNHVARDVTQTLWSGCRAGTIVEGYRIRGGGHTWPGALAASGPGATTHEIDATQTLAAFFRI